MMVRAVDEKNNWIFGKGMSSYCNNILYVKQTILTRIKELRNDCWFNQNAGIDYDNRLGKSNPLFLEQDIKVIINNIPEIVNCESLNLSLIDRKLFVSYKAISIYGDIESNLVV